jgi:hypothetical protein
MSPVSRRFVLTGTALTGASLLVPIAMRAACAQRNDRADYEITDWILIAGSGQVTLGLSQPEVGQGRTPRCRRSSPTSSTPIGSE